MGEAATTVEALRAAIGHRAAAIDIEWVAETGSTNSDLLARARGDIATHRPRLRVADRQRAGRGRNGRIWHAAPGASLTFSLAWRLAASELRGLSLAVGVAIAEALDARHEPQRHVDLKWPNDLWLAGDGDGGRKLGGILIETTPAQGGGRVAVVGVGINLLEQRVAEASNGVAWLREIDAAATPLSTLTRVVPALIDAMAQFEREGFAAFAARFAARDLLHGRPVRCSGAAAASGRDGIDAVEGIAMGVSSIGELLVRTAAGVESIGSGEVSVRLVDGPATATADETARLPC